MASTTAKKAAKKKAAKKVTSLSPLPDDPTPVTLTITVRRDVREILKLVGLDERPQQDLDTVIQKALLHHVNDRKGVFKKRNYKLKLIGGRMLVRVYPRAR